MLKKLTSILLSAVIICSNSVFFGTEVFARIDGTAHFSRAYTLTGNGADDIVSVARAQVGKNGGQLGYSYSTSNANSGEEWCADFVSDCAILAGQSSAIPANAGCSAMQTAIKNAGGSYISASQARAGDILFYGSGGSAHVEIVYAQRGSSLSTLATIGGNSGNSHNYYSLVKDHPSQGSSPVPYAVMRPNYRVNGKNPEGVIDDISPVTGGVHVGGWAIDKDDLSASLEIHVYIGGEASPSVECHSIKANKERKDVDNVYHYGVNHGFDEIIRTGKSGNQAIYVYAINVGSGNNVLLGSKTVNIPKDSVDPTISNIKITNITEDGYTVSCTVTDNEGVGRVRFPTWTANAVNGNEQDDIEWYVFTEDANAKSITAYHRVKTSDHKNESGIYHNHIYAADQSENEISVVAPSVNVPIARDHIPTEIFTYNGSTYAIYDDAMSWTDADKLCKNIGGHLISITSQGESEEIAKYINENNRYWIGLSDTAKEGTFAWRNGESFNYNNWADGEPNNKGDEDYVELYVSSKKSLWNDTSNDEYTKGTFYQYGFIFEIEDSSIKLNKTSYFGNKKYEFYKTAVPYSVAEYYARQKGGHVVTINSAEENEFVGNNLIGSMTWLGVTRKDNEFKNITGEPLDYANWADGEPNNDCGRENYVLMLSDKKKWNDCTNATGAYFVIEYEDVSDIGTDFTGYIYNVGTRRVLTANSDNNVVVETDKGTPNQRWLFKRGDDGYYTIINTSNNYCLDNFDATGAPNSNVWVYPANGSSAQKWQLYELSDGCYFIMPQCSSGTCIDVLNNEGKDGVNVQLYDCSAKNNTAQQFIIYKNDGSIANKTTETTTETTTKTTTETTTETTTQGKTDTQDPGNTDSNMYISTPAYVGVNSEFTLSVNMQDAPEAAGGEFVLEYDPDILQVTDTSAGEAMSRNSISPVLSPNYDKNKVYFTFANAQDKDINGTLLNVKFKAVKEGKAQFKLSHVSFSDYELNDLYLTTSGGSTTVSDTVMGDVNGDKEINYKDSILILRDNAKTYSLTESQKNVADVNKDGSVNYKDSIMILRFASGGNVSF